MRIYTEFEESVIPGNGSVLMSSLSKDTPDPTWSRDSVTGKIENIQTDVRANGRSSPEGTYLRILWNNNGRSPETDLLAALILNKSAQEVNEMAKSLEDMLGTQIGRQRLKWIVNREVLNRPQ